MTEQNMPPEGEEQNSLTKGAEQNMSPEGEESRNRQEESANGGEENRNRQEGPEEDPAQQEEDPAQQKSASASPWRRIPNVSFSPKQRLASPLARCLCIGFLTLLLLLPLDFVRDIAYSRSYLYDYAAESIAQGWGATQVISGPAIIIPYETWRDHKERIIVKVDGRDETKEITTRQYTLRHKVVLPADLSFDARMDPEIRYRGIYRKALYNAPISISGSFVLPGAGQFADNVQRIHWEHAWLAMGISDTKAISEALPATWNGKSLTAFKPSTKAGELLGTGFHAELPLAIADAGMRREFSLNLRVRGSDGLFFTPVGENTVITMQGSWPSPSFQGDLLPVTRTISEKGFSAEWVISNLTRTYPQTADLGGPGYFTSNGNSAITPFNAGLHLHEPVTIYRMVQRSADYGILFIAVTFIALFLFEMASRRQMHLIQYGMVGLSMSLFYLVLLSLSEHIAFGLAFVAASGVTIAMNSLYVGATMQSKRHGLGMAGLLAALYAVLFSLLRLEDFSLLMGTGLILLMMGALMYVTRNLPQATPRAAP